MKKYGGIWAFLNSELEWDQNRFTHEESVFCTLGKKLEQPRDTFAHGRKDIYPWQKSKILRSSLILGIFCIIIVFNLHIEYIWLQTLSDSDQIEISL
jgi:hypothetical protein